MVEADVKVIGDGTDAEASDGDTVDSDLRADDGVVDSETIFLGCFESGVNKSTRLILSLDEEH
eukprot:1363674-Ditylum_brightwellii.AAC.1